MSQARLLDGRRYPIRIGSDVSIGPEAAMLTLGHDPRSPEFADRGGPVTIGEGAVVGAGAVVSRDVEPFTIVAGNPARPIGGRPQLLRYRINYKPFMLRSCYRRWSSFASSSWPLPARKSAYSFYF